MLKRILEETKKNGGVTYSLAKDCKINTGYAVSTYKDRECVINGELTEEKLANFIQRNKDLLYWGVNCIGIWVHKGNTYLDISKVVGNALLALNIAKCYHQKAIYDLEKQQEIFI